MKVWLLPIEPFEERYTADWHTWFPNELREQGLVVETIDGERVGEREGGEWLDPVLTWKWKGTQVANLASQWHRIRDGDAILSLDAWGAATTAALYMRETTGRKVRVAGFWHAGAWDPHDYLSRVGCGPWAGHLERGWATGLDLCLAGSHFSADLIRAHVWPHARIEVVGCPVKEAALRPFNIPWHQRKHVVVFPHRLAPEKGLLGWTRLEQTYRERYPDDQVSFLATRDHYTDKASLYRMLGSSRVVVSTALQETFGIVMQEAVALGCHPVAPRRLSYPETLRGQGALYDSTHEAVEAVRGLLTSPNPAVWDGYHEHAISRVAMALKRIP